MPDLDIASLILSEHEAFRRAFAEIEGLRDSDAEQAPLRWKELADQLEVHAAGEEAIFYPALLHEVDDSEGDTKHAVKDHNEIREATRAVEDHEAGSDSWWEALVTAREATVEHLGEEETDVLPLFKQEVAESVRTELGMQWLAFHDEHEQAKGLSGKDKDPDAYVEKHT